MYIVTYANSIQKYIYIAKQMETLYENYVLPLKLNHKPMLYPPIYLYWNNSIKKQKKTDRKFVKSLY